jgi:hypothetical protein
MTVVICLEVLFIITLSSSHIVSLFLHWIEYSTLSQPLLCRVSCWGGNSMCVTTTMTNFSRRSLSRNSIFKSHYRVFCGFCVIEDFSLWIWIIRHLVLTVQMNFMRKNTKNVIFSLLLCRSQLISTSLNKTKQNKTKQKDQTNN